MDFQQLELLMARNNNLTILQQMAMDEAEVEDIAPHEWLKRIVDGLPIRQMVPIKVKDANAKDGDTLDIEWVERDFYPNLETRIDAAKHSAQFFAPKYTAIKASITKAGNRLTHFNDGELDQLMADLAHEGEEDGDNNGVIYDTSD